MRRKWIPGYHRRPGGVHIPALHVGVRRLGLPVARTFTADAAPTSSHPRPRPRGVQAPGSGGQVRRNVWHLVRPTVSATRPPLSCASSRPLSSTVRRLLSPSQDALLEPPMLRAPRGRVRARSARPAVRGKRRVPRVHGLPPLRRVWVLHGRAAHVLRANGRRAWLGCGAARAARSGREGARGRGPGREKGRRNRSLCEIARATAAARGAGS